VSVVLASHRYARGRGHGGHRERGSLRPGRRMADDGRLRAGTPVGVLPRSAGVLHRDNDHVHGPCRGHHGLGVPDHGENSVHARLCLSCHGPCPCPHDGRGRDGLGERSGDVPSHRGGDDESGL
jgi:hypothetical protein